jgi:prepilin-type N-terminal cleavage/methylation domain-containing protein
MEKRRTPHAHPRPRPGFSLIELLVAISIIALLVGILLPALSGARKSALEAQCKSNLRQVSAAQFMYHQDFGVFARLWSAADGDGEAVNNPISPLADYLEVDRRRLPEPGSVMQCPAVEPAEFERLAPLVQPGNQVSSYGINPAMQFDRWDFSTAKASASDLILVGEQALEPFEQLQTSNGKTAVPLPYSGAAWLSLNNHDPHRGYRHFPGGANFAMHDGSARRLFHEDLTLSGKHWAWWDTKDDPWTLQPMTSLGDPGGCGCGE